MKDKNNLMNFDIQAEKITKNVEKINNRIQSLGHNELSSMDKTSMCIAKQKESIFMSQLNEDGKKNFILKKKLFELFSPYEREEKILDEIFALPILSLKKLSNLKLSEFNRNSKLKMDKENTDTLKRVEITSPCVRRLGATSFVSVSKDFKKDSAIDSKLSFNFRKNLRTMYRLNDSKDSNAIPNLKNFKINNRKSEFASRAESCVYSTQFNSVNGGETMSKFTRMNQPRNSKKIDKESFKFNEDNPSHLNFSGKSDYSNETRHRLNKSTFKTIADLNVRKNTLEDARKDVIKYLNEEKLSILLKKDSANLSQSSIFERNNKRNESEMQANVRRTKKDIYNL